MSMRINRPRRRKHRKHSRRYNAFLAAMAAKYSGQETTYPCTAVDDTDDFLTLTGDYPHAVNMPSRVDGPPPPELRDVTLYAVEASDETVVRLGNQNGALVDFAAWDITPDAASVAVASDTVFIADHGFQTGSGPVQLTTDGVLPTGLAAATNYWIIDVADDRVKLATSKANADAGTAVAITAAGSGVHTATWTETFAAAAVDDATDEITATAHGLLTGDGPVQLTTDDTEPAGIDLLTDYWVIRIDDDTLQLAASREDALAGTEVDITDPGAGNHTLTRAVDSGVVSVTSNEMSWPAHGMETGDGPVTLSSDGALPTGLAALTDYYIIASSDDTVAFATSEANALAGTAVNVTAAGSGTHTMDRTFSLGADLTADGIEKWMALGHVSRRELLAGAAEDADTIFDD
jgi:plastocyanin